MDKELKLKRNDILYHANRYNQEKVFASPQIHGAVGLWDLRYQHAILTKLEELVDIVKKEICGPGLVDEVVVINADSFDRTAEIAESKGFKAYQHSEIASGLNSYKGKGEGLWKSLFVLKGDIIIWCDSDIRNFSSRFIYGLLGPLLTDDKISFVKAFYQRPLKINGAYMKGEGGRVTEIMIKPMLNFYYPELSHIYQPLSREYAGRKEVFERIPFFTGYGVEIGMLIDIYEKYGLESIAQINIKRRVHRNQPLSALSRMSFGILQAIFKSWRPMIN